MEEQEGVEEVEAPGYGDQLHVATPAPPPRPIAQLSTATTTTTSPLPLLPLLFLPTLNRCLHSGLLYLRGRLHSGRPTESDSCICSCSCVCLPGFPRTAQLEPQNGWTRRGSRRRSTTVRRKAPRHDGQRFPPTALTQAARTNAASSSNTILGTPTRPYELQAPKLYSS